MEKIDEEKINKKLALTNNLLNYVYDILKLFKPLMERMIELEETKKYKNIEIFQNVKELLGKISLTSYEIGEIPSHEFLKDLKN